MPRKQRNSPMATRLFAHRLKRTKNVRASTRKQMLRKEAKHRSAKRGFLRATGLG